MRSLIYEVYCGPPEEAIAFLGANTPKTTGVEYAANKPIFFNAARRASISLSVFLKFSPSSCSFAILTLLIEIKRIFKSGSNYDENKPLGNRQSALFFRTPKLASELEANFVPRNSGRSTHNRSASMIATADQSALDDFTPLSGALQISENAVASEFCLGVSILNITTGAYYRLEGVSWFVWRELATGCDFQDLCLAVQNAYQIDLDTSSKDLKNLLGDLIGNGLVTLQTHK
jgi:hypothetical protein